MKVCHPKSSRISILLAMLGLLIVLAGPAFPGTVWTVFDEDPAVVDTEIQEAVDLAVGGDIINVYPGTYSGINLGLSKNLVIEGVGYPYPVIDGTGMPAAVCMGNQSGSTELRYFTITSDDSDGIWIVRANFSTSGPQIEDNIITGCGGAGIRLQRASPTVQYNEISYNGNSGVNIIEANPALRYNDIIYNYTDYEGGGICISTTDEVAINDFDITDNYIAYNRAGWDGGGVYAWCDDDSTLSLIVGDDTEIIGNVASGYGGGICLMGYVEAEISASGPIYGDWHYVYVEDNSAAIGGGLFIDVSNTVVVHAVQINGNSADFLGGGAYFQPYVSFSTDGDQNIGGIDVTLNWFRGNTSYDGGGAALITGGNIPGLTFRLNTVEMNTASGEGGGIFSSSYSEINSNVFNANIAAVGGGMEAGSGEYIIYNFFTDNAATEADAGLRVTFTDDDVLVMNNEFYNNIAAGGAGGLGAVDDLNFVVIQSNLFEGNYSGSELLEGRGGAIRVETGEDSYVKIIYNTFVDNAVSGPDDAGRGAALYLDVNAPLDVADNIIANNLAGGGVYVARSAVAWTLITYNNCWQNQGFNWGGGIADMTGRNSNFSADPMFTKGPLGDYYLSERDVMHPGNSPFFTDVDSTSLNVGGYTPLLPEGPVWTNSFTRIDMVPDQSPFNVGYHYVYDAVELPGGFNNMEYILDCDDDDDGLPNLYELRPGLGAHAWTGNHPWGEGLDVQYNPEWDGDAEFDSWSERGDYDGLIVIAEYLGRTNPQDFDTDDDRLADGSELIDYNSPYTPGGGVAAEPLLELDRLEYLTDPANADTDGDGVSDGDEVNLYGTDPLEADTGIFGVVTSAATGDGISGAYVIASQDGFDMLTVQANSGGTYVAHIDAGTYDVSCRKVRYESQTTTDVTVEAGHVTIVDFSLDYAKGIAGTVTSAADGSALAGASVALYSGGVLRYTLTTDENGDYGEEVIPGVYNITCSRAGYVSQTRTGVTIPADTSVVVNFALLEVSGISGRVTRAATGAGIADASIIVSLGGVEVQSITTGADGSYSMEIDPGTYRVDCQAVGFVDQWRTGVTVLSNAHAVVNFSLAASAAVNGLVTSAADGSLVSGAAVRLYSYTGGILLFSTTTDSDGNYALDRNIASGTFTIEVSKTGYATQARVVTLYAGQTYNLHFVLSPLPNRIEGRVTRAGASTGIANARIAAYQNGVVRATASSNSSGQFALNLGYAGDYTIMVSATNYYHQHLNISVTVGELIAHDFALTPFSGNPVVLASPTLDPTSGLTTTTYTFTVTYSQEWGKAAYRSYLYLDGRAKVMQLVSGEPYTGAVYRYTATLAAGTHKYYFSLSDGKYARRLPTSGSFVGPVVTKYTAPSPASEPTGSGGTTTGTTTGAGTTSGSGTTTGTTGTGTTTGGTTDSGDAKATK